MSVLWTIVTFLFTFGVLGLVAYALIHLRSAARDNALIHLRSAARDNSPRLNH